ncbi:hypothetical protein F441_02882 [Phytophthora nicotianae CJ01A1]|uniref:Uncharacterized protein n=3 Tax=Phytophthora nicotianae TaxID=4792 RepID=W2XQ70_PHYNI|nr:hypothetical protein L917_02685 [Phytophthora nicotianae]ETO83003.1 hypothetical protein F444_02917 [Phytophthora nicotianae P1976]ETP24079.1 hypothetical protein F441_02882 [Phytophthora nicotianae CJ01A1]
MLDQRFPDPTVAVSSEAVNNFLACDPKGSLGIGGRVTNCFQQEPSVISNKGRGVDAVASQNDKGKSNVKYAAHDCRY